MILKVSSDLDGPVITQRGKMAATLLFIILELVNVAEKELRVPQRTDFWHPDVFQTPQRTGCPPPLNAAMEAAKLCRKLRSGLLKTLGFLQSIFLFMVEHNDTNTS